MIMLNGLFERDREKDCLVSVGFLNKFHVLKILNLQKASDLRIIKLLIKWC